VQLAEWQVRFAALGVNVAAMSYDPTKILSAFAASQEIRYPLLSDATHTHVDAYGIRNEEYPLGHSAYGIPHPGILFIDNDGIVVLKFALPDYRKRPDFNEVFAAVAAVTSVPGEPAAADATTNE
jgi:peroxiredoxin